MNLNLDALDTERNNGNTKDIDTLSTLDMVKKINQEDRGIAECVGRASEAIATLVDQAYQALKNGGRLIYIGAGTSGRLGVLDASECPPTYGVSAELVQGLIAGGQSAMFKSKEGAEDSREEAVSDLKDIRLNERDMVVGLAASGRTPYVIGGLRYAQKIGARTGSIACVKNAAISQEAQCPVEVITGAEVVTGSTRMKAGTAQKMVLNMISTSVMIKLGKVYQNYMVDVQPTNEKLVMRAKNIIQTLTALSPDEVDTLFIESHKNVKLAIVMGIKGIDKVQAEQLLVRNDNRVALALQDTHR